MTTTEDHIARYLAALHAMQSGVAAEQGKGSEDGTPKSLRVGLNATKSDQAGLVGLLIAKGIITYEEYTKAIADEMEAEKDRYEERLTARYGTKIRLA